MNNQQLKELEDKLWDSANSLRAYGGIKAADYAVPVLGLIFLKFADNKYKQFEDAINEEFEKYKGSRMEQSIQIFPSLPCLFLPGLHYHLYLQIKIEATAPVINY